MCLYPTEIRNPKYLTNEKNRGIIPIPKNNKQLTIQTRCGWCIECRKRLASEWRIRLMEEYKTNRKAEFVTLSFAPEEIKKLEQEIINKKFRGIEGTEIDVNILAAYSIRMYTERLRKKYKTTTKHWFITELGHTNTERIHLHGIMWRNENWNEKEFKKDISEKWQYGNIYVGQYVTEKTINYIVKYITKMDEYHIGYKQRIITSKGIGKDYIKREGIDTNRFNNEKTNTKYRTKEGTLIELPRYYKDKIYSEEQREALWIQALEKGEIYIKGIKFELENQDDTQYRKDFLNCLETSRKDNKRSKYGTNKTVNKKYIITETMKCNYIDFLTLRKEKLVKCVERRKLEKIQEYNEKKIDNYEGFKGHPKKEYIQKIDTEELSKTMLIDKYIYGEYINTTTEAERNYNKLLKEAKEENLRVRQIRLKKKGLPYK